MKHFAYLTLLLVLFAPTFALHKVGTIKNSGHTDYDTYKEGFYYVANFAMSATKQNDTYGSSFFKYQILTGHTDTFLAFYNDLPTSWSSVYKNKDQSCLEKLEHSIHTGANFIKLKTDGVFNHTSHFKDVIRPHIWYLAVVHCDESEDFELNYDVTLLNTDGSQVGFNQKGLFLLYSVASLLYIIFLVIHAIGAIILIREKSYHPIVRILGICILFATGTVVNFCVWWWSFARNGEGWGLVKNIANILDMIMQILFTLLLIFIAQGWAITHQTLTRGKALLTILSLYVVVYIITFLWGIIELDPAANYYLYQSPAGILLLLIRFLTLIYFVVSLIRSFISETDSVKRKFYIVFVIFYSIWFLSLPATVIVASFAPAWYRQRLVESIHTTITLIALSILAFLLWPSRATKYFRITTPDIMGYQPVYL